MTDQARRGSTKVLVLGATGMLGHAVMRLLGQSPGFSTVGSVRSAAAVHLLPADIRDKVLPGVDVEDTHALTQVVERAEPAVVINCVGLVKQLMGESDHLAALTINSVFPHRLARVCAQAGARLVHFSTDCVFSGDRGMYREDDLPDARDLYGLTKYLGEVDYPGAITLRTSIIGHELVGAHGLVEWFLAQSGSVKGYTRAIFSGLTTLELSLVIRDYVLPRDQMRGVYHVAARPISKHDLLKLVAETYGKSIEIIPDDHLRLDRSLDGSRFTAETGYRAPEWPSLIKRMREFQ